jgi:glycerate kinase
MRLLVAPDSFGGHLSAPDAARRIVAALRAAGHDAVAHPMADGGEGSLCVLEAHGLVSEVAVTEVTGPYGETVEARIGRIDDDAFVEVAEACGLWRTTRREPSHATSEGVGEMLLDAAGAVEGRLLVGLGGTATVDAGVGALRALGLEVRDDRIDGDPPLADVEVTLLADVRAPFLLAPERFGPQKGLRPDEVGPLADRFRRLADALAAWCERQGFPPLERDVAGGGAAGGLGFALASVLDATIESGAEWFARATDLDRALLGADAVIVGEGRLDGPSFDGKVAGTVAAHARSVPVWAIVGSARERGTLARVVEIGGTDDAQWWRALRELADCR